MAEQDKSPGDPHKCPPPPEPTLSVDEVWEALIHQPPALDPELLKQAQEFVQEKYDETYWEAVRKEAEAFWARRYDPDATEDW